MVSCAIETIMVTDAVSTKPVGIIPMPKVPPVTTNSAQETGSPSERVMPSQISGLFPVAAIFTVMVISTVTSAMERPTVRILMIFMIEVISSDL